MPDAAGIPRLGRVAAASSTAGGHKKHPPTAPTSQETREQRVAAPARLRDARAFPEGVACQALLIVFKVLTEMYVSW